jgi:hypothetical protein
LEQVEAQPFVFTRIIGDLEGLFPGAPRRDEITSAQAFEAAM